MDKSYVIVTGSGQTSRTNVEMLLEDYFHTKRGTQIVLMLAYEKKPSQGQVFAAQFSKSLGAEIVVVSNEGASFDGITSLSPTWVEAANPLEHSFALDNGKAEVLILWDDEDPKVTEIANLCAEYEVKCFDLCNGMMQIKVKEVKEPVDQPSIPEAEKDTDTDLPSLPEPEDDEDEEADEDDIEDEAFWGLQAIVKYVASETAKELYALFQKAQEKGKNGPQA